MEVREFVVSIKLVDNVDRARIKTLIKVTLLETLEGMPNLLAGCSADSAINIWET